MRLVEKQARMRQRQENVRDSKRPKQNPLPVPATPPSPRPRLRATKIIPGGCPYGHGPEDKNVWGHCIICAREAYHRDDAYRKRQVAGVRRRRQARTAEQFFMQVRRNARKRGHIFTIAIRDILPLPTHCPVLGIELDYFGGGGRNAASLDRKDAAKGYVAGNVAIMSKRANTLKNDATLEELTNLLRYVAASVTNVLDTSQPAA